MASDTPERRATSQKAERLVPRRWRLPLGVVALLYVSVVLFGLLEFSSRDGAAVTPAFRFDPSATADTNPTSYRRGTVVRASSYDVFRHHHPLYAIDGERVPTELERWIPASNDMNPYLEFHFGQAVDFEAVRLQFRGASEASTPWPSHFGLRCYSDDVADSTPDSETVVEDNSEASPVVPLVCSQATVLRADFSQTEGEQPTVWLYEIEVIGGANE